jgi:hypothetical protein
MIMSPKTFVVLAVVLVAGVLGGTAAYRVGVLAGSPEPAPRESLVVDSDSTDQVAEKQKARDGRPAFAPCRKPARLEAGKCVTDVVRTVTVPGSSAVAAAPAPAAPAPAPVVPSGGSEQGHHSGHDDGDDHGHHSGEGEDGHHHGGDDDDDDHSGHGHGGDDDDDDNSGHGHGGDDDDRSDDD